jgi:EF-P beta-lysylation protein EpmB
MTIDKWRQVLRQNFTRWERLADFLELSPDQREVIDTQPAFPLNLPMRLAQKIEKRTLNDPILRQFLPLKEENAAIPDFISDPVSDESFRRESKLLHKYEGRALIISTSACAMHCRYCFRRHFDYNTQEKEFDQELDLVANDSSIHEIILSGGDPLSLSNERLGALIDALSVISHIERIRFHTRFPIGIPERIDEGFLRIIQDCPKQVWFVIHSNHPREYDDEIWDRLKAIQKLGYPVLNQTVLLHLVNDDATVLKALSELLVNHGVIPYYLHQLDRVQGAAHFEVSERRGLNLVQEIASSLPGFAVPKYVKEIPGRLSKTPLVTSNE